MRVVDHLRHTVNVGSHLRVAARVLYLNERLNAAPPLQFLGGP